MDLFCPVEGCGRHYLRRRDLKHHVVEKHPTYPETLISKNRSTKDGKQFPCPYDRCPCGYARLRDLQRHLNGKHWPENPFIEAKERFLCSHDGCGREYARMYDLRRHLAEKHEPSRTLEIPISSDFEIFALPVSSTPDEPPPEPLDPSENQWVSDFNFPLLLETV